MLEGFVDNGIKEVLLGGRSCVVDVLDLVGDADRVDEVEMLAVLVRAVLVGERGGESAYHVVAAGEQEELMLMLAVVVVEELTRVLGS